MFTKRTIIGIVVGAIIITIGISSLILSIGLQTVNIDDTFDIGESVSYKFNAPVNAKQNVSITGDSFDVKLSTPGDGPQISLTSHKKEFSYEWIHLADGESKLQIQNTGQSEMYVTGLVYINTDPIHFTYHILVITSGIVIIGFSAGFSIRKPRGF